MAIISCYISPWIIPNLPTGGAKSAGSKASNRIEDTIADGM
jgi:hypothetical protein